MGTLLIDSNGLSDLSLIEGIFLIVFGVIISGVIVYLSEKISKRI